VTPVVVRDASAADAAAIEGVARRSWASTYGPIFDPAYIDEFLARNYAPARLAAAIEAAAARDDAHFLVAERDAVVVAFAQYGVGTRGPELFRIYADPAQYGTGVGAALLAELHRRIVGHVNSYLVDVHVENELGRAFYERRGFVPEGRVAEDGHIALRKTLSPGDASVQSPSARNDSTSSS
jgi:GNAT superfamily N-acetyltransferase